MYKQNDILDKLWEKNSKSTGTSFKSDSRRANRRCCRNILNGDTIQSNKQGQCRFFNSDIERKGKPTNFLIIDTKRKRKVDNNLALRKILKRGF